MILLVLMSLASVFCLTVLIGLYLYSGSILPSVQRMPEPEKTHVLFQWFITIGLPPLTALGWFILFRRRK